jgi:hypothetical protein
VLEHTDNIWHVFDECLRVARLQLMIVLPNSYHWKERLRFLRGRGGQAPSARRADPRPASLVALERHLAGVRTARAERHGLTWTDALMVDDRRNLGRSCWPASCQRTRWRSRRSSRS